MGLAQCGFGAGDGVAIAFDQGPQALLLAQKLQMRHPAGQIAVQKIGADLNLARHDGQGLFIVAAPQGQFAQISLALSHQTFLGLDIVAETPTARIENLPRLGRPSRSRLF